MTMFDHMTEGVLWTALALLAYYGGGWAALFLLGWAINQRHEIGRLRATAIFWQKKCRTMSQDIDKVIAHATAPSPEEELLVATRRKMILQWGEEDKRE